MKNKVLSIEQMEYLVKLGLDTSNASLFWVINTKNELGKTDNLSEPYLGFQPSAMKVGAMQFKYIPTYTLQDILEKLPLGVKKDNITYELTIDEFEGVKIYAYISYKDNLIMDYISPKDRSNMLNSAYFLLCWCIENRCIKI